MKCARQRCSTRRRCTWIDRSAAELAFGAVRRDSVGAKHERGGDAQHTPTRGRALTVRHAQRVLGDAVGDVRALTQRQTALAPRVRAHDAAGVVVAHVTRRRRPRRGRWCGCGRWCRRWFGRRSIVLILTTKVQQRQNKNNIKTHSGVGLGVGFGVGNGVCNNNSKLMSNTKAWLN